MSVIFNDYNQEVKTAMNEAKKQALTAIGLAAVEVTTDYMQSRYGAPIRQTGDLIRDLNSKVRLADELVDIGNSLEYAAWVHNGTARMSGRPYLTDAATENADIWEQIAEEYISDNMK